MPKTASNGPTVHDQVSLPGPTGRTYIIGHRSPLSTLDLDDGEISEGFGWSAVSGRSDGLRGRVVSNPIGTAYRDALKSQTHLDIATEADDAVGQIREAIPDREPFRRRTAAERLDGLVEDDLVVAGGEENEGCRRDWYRPRRDDRGR